MGSRSKLMSMSREYMHNPKGQHFKYLLKVLNLSKSSGVSKEEELDFVKKWYKNQ